MQAPVVSWVLDPVLHGFEAVTMPLAPADDGTLVATLVRRRAPRSSGRAVLHVHGFVDYFFHSHVADALNARGWDVYALDLRRSGRSLRTGNRPYFARDLREYDEEISLAIAVITAEPAHRLLCLSGHSNGGLIAALYMHQGSERRRVDALALNSPFFGFKLGSLQRLVMRLVAGIGSVVTHIPIPGVLAPEYVQSLHRNFRGEWDFDLRWKPEHGFPAYTGWFHAVRTAHAQAGRGLSIEAPVLMLRSARSITSRGWDDGLLSADGVLDVRHMQQTVALLGARVTEVVLDGAVHDVFLSRAPVRHKALDAYGSWLDALPVPQLLKS